MQESNPRKQNSPIQATYIQKNKLFSNLVGSFSGKKKRLDCWKGEEGGGGGGGGEGTLCFLTEQ